MLFLGSGNKNCRQIQAKRKARKKSRKLITKKPIFLPNYLLLMHDIALKCLQTAELEKLDSIRLCWIF